MSRSVQVCIIPSDSPLISICIVQTAICKCPQLERHHRKISSGIYCHTVQCTAGVREDIIRGMHQLAWTIKNLLKT